MNGEFVRRKFGGTRAEPGNFEPLPGAAQLAARAVFDLADDKRKAAILWDAEPRDKRELLAFAVSRAIEATAFFGPDMTPLAFAWTAWNGGCPTAQAHFFTSSRVANPAAFMRAYLDDTIMTSIVGALPAPFFGARELVRQCGFKQVAVVPKCAWLAAKKRAVDLVLCVWNKEEAGRVA